MLHVETVRQSSYMTPVMAQKGVGLSHMHTLLYSAWVGTLLDRVQFLCLHFIGPDKLDNFQKRATRKIQVWNTQLIMKDFMNLVGLVKMGLDHCLPS